MAKGCSHPGCTRKHSCKGYCATHYGRWSRGGDMDAPFIKHNATEPERFWPKVRKDEGCWEWGGAKFNGYGVFRSKGAARLAHRVSYEWEHGEIPSGMEVDHTCFNRSCVNPGHLRLLDHAENGRNRSSANSNSKSGIRGVYQLPNGTWIARAMLDRQAHEIGRYETSEDAEAAAVLWRREHMPSSINDMERNVA